MATVKNSLEKVGWTTIFIDAHVYLRKEMMGHVKTTGELLDNIIAVDGGSIAHFLDPESEKEEESSRAKKKASKGKKKSKKTKEKEESEISQGEE
jgi:hypothetical protein